MTNNNSNNNHGEGDITKLDRILKKLHIQPSSSNSSKNGSWWGSATAKVLSIILIPCIGLIILVYVSKEKLAYAEVDIAENKVTITSNQIALRVEIRELERNTMGRELLSVKFNNITRWQNEHGRQFDEFKIDTKEEFKDQLAILNTILQEVRK